MADEIWSNSSAGGAAALSAGMFEDARATYEILLAHTEKHYGRTDLRSASCHQGLGEAFEGLGNLEQAERHLKRALTIVEQRLGAFHPYSLRVTTALGAFYRRNKHTARAEFALRKAFRGWGQLRSNSGLDVCETLDEMAALYAELGRKQEAERFADNAALIRVRAQAKTPHEMLSVTLAFARQKIAKQNQVEAETLLKDALSVAESMPDPDCRQVAEILCELGHVAVTDYRFDEAVYHLERALAILSRSTGDRDTAFAATLRQLGSVYWISGQAKRGAACYEETLEIAKRISGENSEDAAADHQKLAIIYLNTAELERAEKNALSSLTLFEKLRGSNHPDVAAALKALSDIRMAQGRVEEAQELLNRMRAALNKENG